MSDLALREPIEQFLSYLQSERNYSDYTLKSYSEDMQGWLEYTLELHLGHCPEPSQIDPAELRGYLSAMVDANYSKATISRRLSALRSFFKFTIRQGWRADNPAAALRNPKAGEALLQAKRLAAEQSGGRRSGKPARLFVTVCAPADF